MDEKIKSYLTELSSTVQRLGNGLRTLTGYVKDINIRLEQQEQKINELERRIKELEERK